MVSEDRLRVRVAYGIALAVGQEVSSIAENILHACQDTLPSVPLCNVVAELSPPSGGNTGSGVCVPDLRIGREHPSPFLVAGVIV